jgi:hypothetical protein
MDPNLFAIDSERLFEVLMGIIVLSFLVERALAPLFEATWFVERFAGKGAKEPLTIAIAFAVCRFWDFDAISVIFLKDHTQVWGHAITAGVIAGGSKASVKLFHDVFNVMSSAERARRGRAPAPVKPKPSAAPVEAT